MGENSVEFPSEIEELLRKQFQEAAQGSDFLNRFTLSQFMKKGYPNSPMKRLQKGSAQIIDKFGGDSQTISFEDLLVMYIESWNIDPQKVRDEISRRSSIPTQRKKRFVKSRRKVSMGEVKIQSNRKHRRNLSLSITRSSGLPRMGSDPTPARNSKRLSYQPCFSASFLKLNNPDKQ